MSILETNSSAKDFKDKLSLNEGISIKTRASTGSELPVVTQSPHLKSEMSFSFTENIEQPLIEHEEIKAAPIPIENIQNLQKEQKDVTPIVPMEDHGKGSYSLGYMEVKMKSNAQWTKLYTNIFKGCLLFYKSFKVLLKYT